jgi:two-component system, sensor histidine kinase RegB
MAVIDRVPPSFLRLLCTLRWVAVAGQAITVALVTGPMQVALQRAPLWSAIGLLAAFNVHATLRARRAGAGDDLPVREVFAHILVDVAALTWLVSWSGGVENPFSSLFLLPIALSILALPPRWVGATAFASIGGYALSALVAADLPHVHGVFDDAFSLHKAGMLVNFAVSAVVVLVFFARVAASWRESEREVARLREQFARNEGILALATHAASVAHELNTPLGTLTLMVDELAEASPDAAQREDFRSLRALLDVCRDRVRELAAPAGAATGPAAEGVDLERVIERWQLVRPTVDLRRSGSLAGCGPVDPAIGHLLQALLNNAADAGGEVGQNRVDLDLHANPDGLVGRIRDYGVGFEQAEPVLPATLYRTSKPDGMGIGLALSHATVERLGGELSMQSTGGRGVEVRFRLPTAARA